MRCDAVQPVERRLLLAVTSKNTDIHTRVSKVRSDLGARDRDKTHDPRILGRFGKKSRYLDTDRFGDAVRSTRNSFLFVGFETLGYMLLGMACLKSGMLTGEWTRIQYQRWAIIGFATGVPAFAALAFYVAHSGFDLLSVAIGSIMLPTLFRPLMIIGWACLILLARPGALATRIAAAGRMAFTNYLGTTILCTTLFYGYGFGLYGHLSRAELYLVVFAVWALMLLWPKPWLEHFRYGPFEWLWRSLARLRLQPIRGGAIATE